MKDFLVWSDKCKIPNLDPYDSEILKYIKRQKYEPCSKNKPLTRIQFNSTTKRYTLYVDEELMAISYQSKLSCHFQNIERMQKGKIVDNYVRFTNISSFNKSIEIPNTVDNILVTCKSNQTIVYRNGYAMIPERPEIRKRLNGWKKNCTTRPPSILMFGIDSISRINLLRLMPKTAQILYNQEWFEMSGYNKIDDNTFPNVMAILTGFNLTNVDKICKPKKLYQMDNCPLIWKLFQYHGYVTAYAEDETFISTFNYATHGFKVPPTDYYLRPFLIAAEDQLNISRKSGLTFCLGYQHSADYVFNYAIELATRYKNSPFFGLFWTNSFSHNKINDCSSMDFKVAEYIEKLSSSGILNESIIIFFSDHGSRFGPARFTLSGYFEERLPFMFIWLPPWFKTKYPEFVNNLSVNKNRLTNPYDIHMTLKNLLELSGRTSTDLPKSIDCPNCQSLLKPVPYNRSCKDVSINDHWCTCIPYKRIDIKSDLVKRLAKFVIRYMNNYLQDFNNNSTSKLCRKLYLSYIFGSYQAILIDNHFPKNLRIYRILLVTIPGNGFFSTTIRHNTETEELEITGSISRLNSYATHSECISNATVKLYCECPQPNIFWRLWQNIWKNYNFTYLLDI